MLTDAPARSYPNAKLTTTVGTTAANTAGTAEYDVFNIGYLYSNNRYEYDAYFIVDKQGFYIINFQSYISGRDDIDISACPSERVKITFNTNQKNENNYRLREGAKDPYYSKMTREAFDESGGYFFYVK